MNWRKYLTRPECQLAMVLGGVLSVHLIFLLFGTYVKSYDAFTHIFLASHWQQHWWQCFEPRWYTGFSIMSYPPFAHQLVALLAFVVGLQTSFVLMLLLSLAGIGLGMCRFTRLWFSHAVALVAAALVLLLPGLTMTTHLFGQFPNLVNLALTLNLLPYAARWLKGGPWQDLLKGELLLIAAACTSLFSNFSGILAFALPIFFLPVLQGAKTTEAEDTNRYRRRLAILLLLGFATLFVCLLPFFAYMQAHPVAQVSIPHASRGNVLAWKKVNYFTFYGLYGPQLLLLPLVLFEAFKRRETWGFGLSSLGLFLLSLGGSNPLNAYLLHSLFEILTFDRFAFWNGVLMTPLLALLAVQLWQSLRQGAEWGRWLRGGVLFGLALSFLAFALVNMSSPFWKPLPRRLDTRALATYLDAPRFEHYRFLTLGLGSYNLSALSTWTSRQNLDGNYNLARRLPELNASPVGQLDDAKYYGEAGLNTVTQFLLNPEKYHLKYLILGDLFYTPLLQTCGWYQSDTLPDGLSLWQSSLPITPLPAEPQPESPLYWRLFWGLVPLMACAVALTLCFRSAWLQKSERLS